MFLNAVTSDLAPKAIGPYSPAVKLGDFVYLSGQLGLDVQTGELVAGGIVEQTEQVFVNIKALLSAMGLSTYHIVKTTVFLKDMADFGAMNEVYAKHFNAPYPARSTVAVAGLPKNALVEIECVVIDTLAYEPQEEGCGCSGGCSEGDCSSDSGCCCG
jgi:2-iminobutanoate/2-iminopropanoate deaminase